MEISLDNYESLNPDELEDDFYISDEDRKPIQQMTFVLSTEQVELIEDCISSMMKTDEYKYMENFGNENSRGNALYKILETWKNKK